MSLESLCDKDVVTVYLGTSAIGASGGNTITWGTGVSKRCMVQELGASEQLAYSSRGMTVSHELFFTADPGVDTRYKIVWGSVTMLVKSVYKERRPGTNVVWVVAADHVTTRDR